MILILKIYFILLLFYHNTFGQLNNAIQLSEDEKEKIWQAFKNGELKKIENIYNKNNSNNINNYDSELDNIFDFEESSYSSFEINENSNETSQVLISTNDYLNEKKISKEYSDLSSENNENTSDNSSVNINQILMRNNRQSKNNNFYDSNERIENLRDINEYIWSHITGKDKTKTKLMVHSQSSGSKILEDHSNYHEILTSSPSSGQKSLVIVFDSTGSMFDDLAQMIEAAELITKEFTEYDNNPIYNYIFVPIRDPYIGPKLVTQDVNKFLTEIRQVRLFGGGDCPEPSIGAINLALESALPKSDIFVFTDATAKDYRLDKETIELIQKHQSTLTFLLTGHCNSKESEEYRVYEKLASLSNGEVYNLKKINIREVLLGIRSNLKDNVIPLQYLHSKAAGKHNFDVSVDSNLKQFTVSVAGENPAINVLDPKFKKIENIEEILNLDQLKILNVPNPEPGNWNVKTESDSEHSVKFTALSDLNFNFGFVVKNNHDDAVHGGNLHPILLQNNVLKITPSKDELVHNLTSVDLELIPIDNNDENATPIIINLPLNELEIDSDSGAKTFGTKEFQPPPNMFKIYVNGFDSKKNPLRHLISTAIKAVKGEAPRILYSENYIKAKEGDSTTLECKVFTVSPVTIIWLRNNKKISSSAINMQKVNDLYVSQLNLNDLSLKDSGLYKCVTENDNGIDTKYVQVVVEEQEVPINVHIIQDYLYGMTEGEVNYQISCTGTPTHQKLTFQWYFNNAPIQNDKIEIDNGNLLFKYVNQNMSGNYTCTASNGKMEASDSALIQIKYGPQILRPFEEEIPINYGSNYELDCETIGHPNPEILWTKPNKVYIENFENGTIYNFNPLNEGTYICKVFNNVGPAQQKFFHITGKASGPPKIEKTLNELDLDIHDTLNLTCKCDLCEPLLHNSWIRESRTRNNEPEIIPTFESIEKLSAGQIHHKFFTSNLLIEEFEKQDEGLYTCRLDNEYGSDSWNVYVKVLEPSKIKNIISNSSKVDSMTFEALASQTYEFECKVEGNPKPDIIWYKYNQDLDIQQIIDNNNPRKELLQIFNIDSTHSGEYSCYVNNSKGSDSKDFMIYVLFPPKLKSTEETVIVIEDGKKILLECNVDGNPFPKISWMYNNRTLELDEALYQPSDNILSLTAKLQNSGIYECTASNKIGSIKKNIILMVFAPPKILPPTKEIISANVGDDIYLLCNFTGFPVPDIKWKFNYSPEDEKFIEVSNEEFHKYANNELALHNVSHTMEGIYLCEIENEYGSDIKSYYVNVNYPPKIISSFQSSFKLKPDEQFKLICSADGKPTPEIIWQKSTSIISDFNEILSLTNTNKSISGIYTCIARNSAGTDSKSIEIIALAKPNLIRRAVGNLTSNNITTEYGQDVELYCPIEYANTFVWFKKKSMLNVKLFGNEKFLHLKNVLDTDSGDYTCVGINEVGVQNYTQKLLVMTPPRIRNVFESNENTDNKDFIDIPVRKGENKTLKCSAHGYPEPQVQWRKDKTILSNEFELNLININVAHSGEYACEASNQYGTDTKNFNVRVLVPPSSEQSKDNWIELNQGEDLILECEIYGNPWPKFSREKDGVNLTGELQEALILHYSGLENSGIYKCVAENELGYHEIKFIVNVLVPPIFKVEEMKKQVIFTNKDTIELQCLIQGNPIPILTWTYNNKILVSTSKVSNINLKDNDDDTKEKSIDYILIDQFGNTFTYYDPNEVFGSQLWENQKNGLYGKASVREYEANLTIIIDNDKKKKSGIYSCYAINAIGSNKYDTKVEIYSKPTLKNNNKHDANNPESVTVLKGLPIILSCPWNSNPSPNITWIKDNLLISTKHFNQLILSHDNKTLTIYNAQEDNSGIWICVGNNLLGKDQKSFNVEVLSPPQFKKNDNSIDNSINSMEHTKLKLINGEKTILKCPVVGNPLPQIFWLKDDDNLKISQNQSEKYHSLLPESPTELVINDLQESGLYSCYANNSLGFIEKKFSIEILKYPQIVSDEPNQLNVTEFDPIKIHCRVDGNPKPKIYWYKDSKIIDFSEAKTLYLDSDEEILKIPTVRLEHTGKYACVARNDLGDLVKYFDLNVSASAIWSPWDSWTQCNVSCGSGIKYRKRRCVRLNGEPALNYKNCHGNDLESIECEMQPCPIDGNWSDWYEWEQCPTECWNEIGKKPSRRRFRYCNNPLPRNGGRMCYGEDVQEKECHLNACPIDGGWSAWSVSSPCSVSCGTGIKERMRICNNPKPSNNGEYCKGSDRSVQNCTLNSCPVNGGWSDWSSWSECSQTCGTGIRKRSRQCNNPKPLYGGTVCDGSNIEVAKCIIRQCDNSDLLKKNFLPHNRFNYFSNNIFETLSFPASMAEDYESNTNEENENEYSFATGSYQIVPKKNGIHHTMNNNEKAENKLNTTGKIKVVLEVKSFRPLNKDLKEINLYPGKAPFVIQRINPCKFGQELSNNNECIDIDECRRIENVCKSNEICTNLEGGFDCSCHTGYEMSESTKNCEDIDECLNSNSHNCSHFCNNTRGSYFCSCPTGFTLESNNKTCKFTLQSLEDNGNAYMADYANTTLQLFYNINSPPQINGSEECPDGFQENNGKCEDVNECDVFESDCDENYSCLNTLGSYKCIETICPPEYKRYDIIGQCILMCNESQSCSNNVKIAEIISHTLLSLEKIPRKEPFLKIVNYGVDRRALLYTSFRIDETLIDGKLFELETFGMERGIAYLYTKEKLKHQKLYRLIIEAESYNEKNFELNYVTKFIIFLYLI